MTAEEAIQMMGKKEKKMKKQQSSSEIFVRNKREIVNKYIFKCNTILNSNLLINKLDLIS